MQQKEAELGEDLVAYLTRKYVTDGLDQRAIAGLLDVNPGTVARWMSQLGVRARRTGRPRKVAAA